MWPLVVIAALVAASAAGAGVFSVMRAALRRAARERAEAERAALAGETRAIRGTAEAEAEATRRQMELSARGGAQDARRRADEEVQRGAAEIAGREVDVERRRGELVVRENDLARRDEALRTRDEALKERDTAARTLKDEAGTFARDRDQLLERLAGETGPELKQRLSAEWIEAARAAAAERLRRIDAGINDPEHGRTARLIMETAISRYQGHYLTERLLTNVPIPEGGLPRVGGEGGENLVLIERISHVKLTPSDTGESIRLEGQDSFGREIARRAIARFLRGPMRGPEAEKAVQAIAEELEREVFELGKRAFKELEIPRAHPDIVKLVGKLNYRTSYTQNQWKHAIEASFLCGMMASELGLDVKLARRAALMHDIGKALTHEIDGSHAVIGADLARKLGESEVVANAIGAHHTDEPFNSVYAYLVAAGDAMSGARPGARRQQDDNYAERLEDLTRIAGSFPGVDKVYPVFGGREVRVMVHENRVDDARAVEMSSEIAQRISDELVFPGQIKVTVIREMKAVAVAS